MILTIQKAAYINFKGIKSLELDFNGKSASISGCNGCGKSSIVDGFIWALFGTNANGDSPGSDSFREKPLDENGNIIHHLSTSVQLDFILDGKPFVVKREQTENWIKRRGSTDQTFQGNQTKYFINGVELKKNEFDMRIASIAQSEIFRLIGTLGAFNTLDWRKRRQHLMNLAGNSVDESLLKLDKYKAIADEISRRNVNADDLKKVLSDERKAVGNELKVLPVRIEEVKRSNIHISQTDISDAEYMIAESRRDIEKIENLIIETKAKSTGSVNSQVSALELELSSIKSRLNAEHESTKRKHQTEYDCCCSKVKQISESIDDAKAKIKQLNSELERATNERDKLREEFKHVKAERITTSITCPVCGNPLSEDAVIEAHEKAVNAKHDKLKLIQVDGKVAAAKVTELSDKINAITVSMNELVSQLKSEQELQDSFKAVLDNYPPEPDYTTDKRIVEIEAQLEELKSTSNQSGIDKKIEQLMNRKSELASIIERNQAILAKRDISVEMDSRISEYESQLHDKGIKLSEIELLLDCLEQFTTDRCTALEESINSHFKTVKWKLFNEQINGGIVDCCEAMIPCGNNLVPYRSANTASQISCDVEIADVLMGYYGVKIPLFIDNKERITTLPHIDTQIITLSVSTDKALKIELR